MLTKLTTPGHVIMYVTCSPLLVQCTLHGYSKNLPEEEQAPAAPLTMATFITSLAGCYSGKMLSNYFYGVCMWHLPHGVVWSVNEDEMEVLLKVATKLTPDGLK